MADVAAVQDHAIDSATPQFVREQSARDSAPDDQNIASDIPFKRRIYSDQAISYGPVRKVRSQIHEGTEARSVPI
jgi:hypothetical protein